VHAGRRGSGRVAGRGDAGRRHPPGAAEVCDAANADEDCDGTADDADPSATGQSTFNVDADGDGYGGVPATPRCDGAAGFAADSTDCDDADPAVNPVATEVAGDDADQDCDGTELCYTDADGDGFRGSTTVASADTDCADAGEAPTSATPDCDDGDDSISEGADEDCDGAELCYVDADNDGYRPDDTSTVASDDLDCDDEGEAGAEASIGDCDDGDDAFHPSADEGNCADPLDYNCDGSTGFADADGDGYAACEECDDARTAVNPGADEVCNGRDDDCDGGLDNDATDTEVWYLDADGDGYANPAESATACDAPEGYIASTLADCDDADATSRPDGVEVPDDGIDQDCDGSDEITAGGADSGDTGGPTGDGCSCGGGAGGAGASAGALLALAFVLATRPARGACTADARSGAAGPGRPRPGAPIIPPILTGARSPPPHAPARTHTATPAAGCRDRARRGSRRAPRRRRSGAARAR
jgi:hypothetical protein